MSSKIRIVNKKAKFEYYLHDHYVAGIVLSGSEIKSIRNNKVSIKESFCKFIKDELFIINMNIQKYEFSNSEHYNPKRERKLLLNKKELRKIKKTVDQKGNSIVPTKLFINEKGYAKIEISTATGKKLYDKRQALKEKDIKKRIDKFSK
ncbi:MAG: SsrA-binding protein [Bacteroidetes bacterium MED-G13]|nr:MAG: SsrA-binding protein [Bacteroidetes bacterium MED-G13]|tara:strand:- start:3586 stop:4032 length:447 start_codon:yes stop_codon:yes gene_type:complete